MQETKHNPFDIIPRSVLAGIMIGIGCMVNLSCDNKYIGAFLFGLGLFTILTFGFNLYTGKIGYVVENKPSYIIDLIEIWLGNLIGTLFVGNVAHLTRFNSNLTEKARTICETKLNDDLLSIFILAFFCGMLMFIAADGYKAFTNPFAQVMVVFLPVIVFILSGFEHCVANMCYFTLGGVWSWNSLIYMLIMTAGNTVGGIMMPLVRKITK